MASDPGNPADRRQWLRVKLQARVVITCRDVQDFFAGAVGDISQGGMFLRTSQVRPVGTLMGLRVSIQSVPIEFAVTGMVVRINGVSDAPGSLGPGLGVRFLDLDDNAREAIAQLEHAAHTARKGPP